MGHGRLFGHVLWVCLLGVAVGLLTAWLMRWRLGAYCPTGRGMAGEWVRALFHWATPFAQRPNPPPDRPRHVAPSHQPCSQLPTATPSRLPTAHARCAYHAPCPLYLFFLPPIDALSHGGISFILLRPWPPYSRATASLQPKMAMCSQPMPPAITIVAPLCIHTMTKWASTPTQ